MEILSLKNYSCAGVDYYFYFENDQKLVDDVTFVMGLLL